MRNQINNSILILAMILVSGSVAHAQSLNVSGNADCDGWSTTCTLVYPSGVYSAELVYSVVLNDQSGTEVTRFDWIGQVYRYENPTMMMMQGDSWDVVLNSSCTANFAFHFLGVEEVFNIDMVCGDVGLEPDPEVEPCRRPSGFWKNHPDAWPALNLSLGGVEMDQAQLIQIMKKRIHGNGSLLLARELVAAKLNVANGCDDSISAVIEEADLFLIEHPLSESFWRNRVPSSRDLRLTLSRYNKGGCPETELGVGGLVDEFETKAAATEQTSFSSLKAMYR